MMIRRMFKPLPVGALRVETQPPPYVVHMAALLRAVRCKARNNPGWSSEVLRHAVMEHLHMYARIRFFDEVST